MNVKLDDNIINERLCCPLCKNSLEKQISKFVCRGCASEYPMREASQGESVWDFRIHRPPYSVPVGSQRWAEMQNEYEEFYDKVVAQDDFKFHKDAIDSVKEIYNHEFVVEGRILDVGGSFGTLRHYLKMDRVPFYVSVDPHINVFDNLGSFPNLLKAYPCLSSPCNFLACNAEYLPFVKETFDWVHMRSVLDHFEDPYLALRDAYRVLKRGGKILIGLTVYGGKSSLSDRYCGEESLTSKVKRKFREGGVKALVEAVWGRIAHESADHHMFRWDYDDLVDLLHVTKFRIAKEHWQKPPFSMCVYIAAVKL